MNSDFIEQVASEPKSINEVWQKVIEHDEQVFKAVAKYQTQGFHVLPFSRSEGYCTLKKEAQQAFTCSHENLGVVFKGMDVGLDLHASNLVGIDVDCSEVAAFLQILLPPTCVIGRQSKSISWMFYRLTSGSIPKNVSFRDCDHHGKAGAELGGVKANNAVALPPSKYRKAAETLTWTIDCEPTVMETQSFIVKVNKCFAMALIARHWPGPGNRHEPTLALAGVLAKAGWSIEEAKSSVRILVEVTGGNKLEDRLNEVKSTYERYKKGEKTTGLPSLVKLLDAQEDVQTYLEQAIQSWLSLSKASNSQVVQGTGDGHNFPLSKYALPLPDLMAKELPEQQFIVYPWLPTQALIMLYAARGVGKTWAALEMAISIAVGRDFLAWPVPKRRRVLFIDGEMPLASLQYRLRSLLGSTPSPVDLTLISSELLWQDSAPLNFSQPQQQQRVDDFLNEMKIQGRAPDLIILDNLSSLVTGIDENSNSDLDQFLQWLVKLRSQGYAVMAVHHAGKNGDQRGGSRREDLLDSVVKLERRESLNLAVVDGACFEIKFTKLRGEHPKPMSLVAALTTNDKGHLSWKHEEDQKLPAYMKVVQGIHEHKPATQTALAEKLGYTKQHVSEMIKVGVEKGLINKQNLSLTQKGVLALAPIIQASKKYVNDL